MNNQLLKWLQSSHQMTMYNSDMSKIPSLYDYNKRETKGSLFYAPIAKFDCFFPVISIIGTEARKDEPIGTHDQLHEPYETSLAMVNQVATGLMAIIIAYVWHSPACNTNQQKKDIEIIESLCKKWNISFVHDWKISNSLLNENHYLYKYLNLSYKQIETILSIFRKLSEKYLSQTFEPRTIAEILNGECNPIPYLRIQGDPNMDILQNMNVFINSSKVKRKIYQEASYVLGKSDFIQEEKRQTIHFANTIQSTQKDEPTLCGFGVMYAYLNVAVYKNILEIKSSNDIYNGVLQYIKSSSLTINISQFYNNYYKFTISQAQAYAETLPGHALLPEDKKDEVIANLGLFHVGNCLQDKENLKWLQENLSKNQYEQIYNIGMNFILYMKKVMREKGYEICGEEKKTTTSNESKQPNTENNNSVSIDHPSFKSSTIIDDCQILNAIDLFYKNFEKLPNNYRGKDEEALRDSVLPMLNTTYAMSGMVATGETFNKNGKTDICIKHTDNTNVFIAECKIWKGEKLFEDAINQLFDRYVTWHDTKVALIIFVKQDNFTETIAKAKEAIKKHPYFLRTINAENPTRGSYIFRHAEDKQRQIKLELMLYHFNQK